MSSLCGVDIEVKCAPGGDTHVKLGIFLPHEIMATFYNLGNGELFYHLMTCTPLAPCLYLFANDGRFSLDFFETPRPLESRPMKSIGHCRSTVNLPMKFGVRPGVEA